VTGSGSALLNCLNIPFTQKLSRKPETSRQGGFSQRTDPVEAKGKGVLQTYWVNVGAVRTESSVVSSSHHEPTTTEIDEEP
jgi:hypothetical protein